MVSETSLLMTRRSCIAQLVKLKALAEYLLQSGVGVIVGVKVMVGVNVGVEVGISTDTPL